MAATPIISEQFFIMQRTLEGPKALIAADSSRTGARPHAPPASSASGSLPPWGAAQRLVLRQDAGTDQRVPRAPVFRIHARDKPNETVIFIIANTTRD